MDLTRRRFGCLLLAAGAVLALGARRCAAAVRGVPWVRAVTARVFPGRVIPFDRERARQPGRWAG